MHLSRRLFIAGGSSAAAAASLIAAQPAQAAGAQPASATPGSPPSEPTTVTLLTTTSYVFDTAFRSALPFGDVYGAQIAGPAAELSGAVVELAFDPRVSTIAGDDTVAAWGDHQARCEVRALDGSRAAITLPDLGDATSASLALSIGLPLGRLTLYPHENIGAPTATTVAVRSADGRELATATGQTTAAPVTGDAWGAEVAVLWQTVQAKGAHAGGYSAPAFVRVTSAGPTPIPAGTQVLVTVDSSIVSLSVDGVYADDSLTAAAPSSRGNRSFPGAGLTTVSLHDAVPAGHSVTIAFRLAASGRDVDAERVTFARAWVVGPAPQSPLQRVTGTETAVAVSDSGTPLIEDGFVGRT